MGRHALTMISGKLRYPTRASLYQQILAGVRVLRADDSNPHHQADWLAKIVDAIARKSRSRAGDREIVNRLLDGEYRSVYISGRDYSRRNLVKAVTRLGGIARNQA